MKHSPRTIATLLLLAASLYLSGCATARPAGRETAAVSQQLATAESANAAARSDATFIRGNLSRADGKAAVILEWLRQRRLAP